MNVHSSLHCWRRSLIVDLNFSIYAEEQLVVLVGSIRRYSEASLQQHVKRPTAVTIYTATETSHIASTSFLANTLH